MGLSENRPDSLQGQTLAVWRCSLLPQADLQKESKIFIVVVVCNLHFIGQALPLSKTLASDSCYSSPRGRRKLTDGFLNRGDLSF